MLVTSNANPSPVGSSVTFTATVPTPGLGSATTGTVKIFVDGVAVTGDMALSGSTTYITTTLARGSHNVWATYSGDVNYASATSTTLSQSIGFSPTITLSRTSGISPTTPGANASVTLRARLTNIPGGGYPVPTNMTVTFLDGGNQIGIPANVVFTAGNYDATITINTFTLPLATGSHTITARLDQNNNYNQVTSSGQSQQVGFSVLTNPLSRGGGGSKSITISGAGFTGTPTVGIATGSGCGFNPSNGISAISAAVTNSTTLTVTFMLTSGAKQCNRDVTVTNVGGPVTVSDAFAIN